MANGVLATLLLLIKTKGDTSGLEKTDKALKKTSKSVKNMSRDIGFIAKLSKGFLGYMGIRGIGNVFNSYLQFEKDLGAIKSRFFAITKDETQATEEFEYIRKIANETALDIRKTAESYSIFYSAAANSMGGKAARQIFTDWSNISRVLHLTPYQMERVTYALREMTSKGAIYSQDLRMQIGTHVPNAVGLALKAIGNLNISGVKTLEEFQEKAKGNQPLINRFLVEFSRVAANTYASPEALKKAMQQPDALAQSIKNIGDNFLIEFSRKGGAYMTVKILQKISEFLTSINYEALTSTLGSIAKVVGDIFKYVPDIINILKLILYSLAISQLFKALINIFSFSKAVFYALKQGKFLALLFSKFGGQVGKTIAKQMVLKGAFKTLISLLGGPLSTILIFLPEIVAVIRWIAEKIGGNKKREELLNKPFYNSNLTLKEVSDVFRDIYNKKGIRSDEDVVKALVARGRQDLIGHITYDSSKKSVVIHVNGTDFDNPEDLASVLVEKIKDTDMWGGYNQNPASRKDIAAAF